VHGGVARSDGKGVGIQIEPYDAACREFTQNRKGEASAPYADIGKQRGTSAGGG
jgi:hypothetical protein